MADKRVFIAIDISEPARQAAERHIEHLRSATADVRVGWERSEKLHITMRFLGDVDEANIVRLCDAMDRVASDHSAIDIVLAGTGVFPDLREPRILWLGIKRDNGAMARLAASIEDACEHLGSASEKRNFRPHLTIGRIREPKKGCRLAALHVDTGFSPVAIEVSELVIYESKLRPVGSVYSLVSRHRLKSRP